MMNKIHVEFITKLLIHIIDLIISARPDLVDSPIIKDLRSVMETLQALGL